MDSPGVSGPTEPIMNKNVTDHKKKGHYNILLGIVIAIVFGIGIGGLFPDIAVKFALLGDVFLNALMMIVVPLVIFSMIVGITGLGDIRNLGSIGWRTVLFYLATTGISVFIGLVCVNIIHPGSGISPGEKHPDRPYLLSGPDNRTIELSTGTWNKNHYDKKYNVLLIDQKVVGTIESMTNNTIKVAMWREASSDDVLLLRTEKGNAIQVKQKNGQLFSFVPQLSAQGLGLEVTLSVVQRLHGKEDRGVVNTLEEVLIGDKKSGKEGMIPRNVVNAMVRMEILPLIVFSLLLGAALSVLGPRAKGTIDVIGVLNDAIMRIVHWIMLLAPFGIFGLIVARIGNAGGFKGFLPELLALGRYSFTVLLGLSIHAFVILPLILMILGKKSPRTYARGVANALLNAFSTASSSATLL